jgi:hypothetical protein
MRETRTSGSVRDGARQRPRLLGRPSPSGNRNSTGTSPLRLGAYWNQITGLPAWPAAIDPHVRLGGVGPARFIEYLHRSLVDLQHRALGEVLLQGCHHRFQRGGQLHDPAGHRLPGELDPLAREDLLLAVQRQAIDELARDHLGEQRAVRQRLGQDLRRAGCDAQTRLGASHIGVDRGVLGALDLDHVVLLGQHTQLLGLIEADADMGGGDRRLLFLGQIQDAFHPRQVCRERLALRGLLGFGAFRARRRLGLGDLRVQFLDQDVQLGFVEERQLVSRDPIGLRPEALVPQQLQAFQQEFDLAVALLDRFITGTQRSLQLRLPQSSSGR